MTNAQSRFLTKVDCSCNQFLHPWTKHCANSTAGLLLSSTPYCLRVYTIVYVISLIMRHRIPTFDDLKKTVMGILQSTAFLVTNAFTFGFYHCLLRQLIGHYYYLTVTFAPAFLASLTAILVERPARRPLLALYVANVATETLWNMAETRGWVRSIPNGQAIIFGASISILLYLFRLGLHKTNCKDSIFDILRIFVGKSEEGPKKDVSNAEVRNRSGPPMNLTSILGWVQAYFSFIDAVKGKHWSCQHNESCIKYSIWGGIKPFVGGVSLQVALKLLLNIKKIVQLRMDWRKTFLDKSILKLGMFLGSFSFLYKSVSCLLRHTFDRDDPRFAIPAGLIGSIAFIQYPDKTVALYVMWKMLQIVYNLGIKKGVVPKVPHFTLLLYAFCTAILFHSGILEPKTLRPSYYKFLQAISGERLTKFNVDAFDAFGQNVSTNVREVWKNLHIVDNAPLPKFALAW